MRHLHLINSAYLDGLRFSNRIFKNRKANKRYIILGGLPQSSGLYLDEDAECSIRLNMSR